MGSAVGGPVTRSSGIYGSCLVPRCMGLPLELCSEDLGEKISSRSAVGSIDSEAVIRCIYGVCVFKLEGRPLSHYYSIVQI